MCKPIVSLEQLELDCL